MKKVLLSICFFAFYIFSTAQEKYIVYFDIDKFETSKTETLKMQSWLKDNSEVKIVAIEGFTDEDGTTGYNDTLSKKRVDFIFNYVKDKIKIREDFKARSFGENFVHSKNKAENRKVVINYLTQKDIPFEEIIINNYHVKKTLDTFPATIEVENYKVSKLKPLSEVVKTVPIGTIFRINDINFQYDSDKLMLNSISELKKWTSILNENTSLKIVILGHICCIPVDDIWLSSRRAKSVYDYFISQGINQDRMSYFGFGATKPKFKIPEKNGYEALMNRRVEILIFEK